MSKLIIQEPPLQVLPSLALAIGLNEAIVLQQLHYLLRDPEFGKVLAAHKWIFNTVEQWRCRYFPFWHQRTIKTVFSNLAKMNLIITCQPEGRMSRRKYYRINEEELARIADGAKFVPSNGQQSSIGNGQNSSLPITKTTQRVRTKNSTSTVPPDGTATVQRQFTGTVQAEPNDSKKYSDGQNWKNHIHKMKSIRPSPY